MDWLLSLLGLSGGGLWAALAAIAGVIAVPLVSYFKGRKDAGTKAKLKTEQERADTFERMANADVSLGNEDADRDWLESRGKRVPRSER